MNNDNATEENYGDFLVTKSLYLQELQATLKELIHVPSGAQVMHIQNDDPENLFSLSFKTLPKSSNGAPHILEHTVLCGSQKFPVKDPFFSMTRRSLNTYMNALTGADFTCYPAASQVEKDFYNLLEVYIDAVFHPKLKKFSFEQEGWRLEFSDPKDSSTPLEYKGIVYNEMKGGLSSAEVRLWHAMMHSLIPDLPYAFNSGGDPKEIPLLSYQELIEFHETYYHPSRCLFFFYGNIPLKHHLDFISENALKNVQRAAPIPPLPKQVRFSAPIQKQTDYPINEGDDLDESTFLALGWLTAPLSEQEDVLALQVLDIVLMETDAAPLKHALLQSGLCVEADGVIDTEMSEVPYIIICKGAPQKNQEALKNLIFSTLRTIVKEGIPEALVDAAVHQLEFDRMEIGGDHTPFGLTLFLRSALAKQHNCPPENALTVHALFETLLKKLEDSTYLTGMIQTYLLDNPHRVDLMMIPDPKCTENELKEEKERLAIIRAQLTPDQVENILLESEKLSLYQRETEIQSIDCLPKISLDDIPERARDLLLKEESLGSLRVFHTPCFTNKILYTDLIFELPPLTEEELPYIPLLATLLPEIGSGSRSYRQNLEYIQAHTGGITASCGIYSHINTPHLPRPYFTIKGKALNRKQKELCTLLYDTAVLPQLRDKKRIEELLKQFRSGLESRFTRHALRYASQLALSGYSQVSYLSNSWHGLPYFQWMQKLGKNLEQELDRVIENLCRLHDKIFLNTRADLVLSCEEDAYKDLKREKFWGLSSLPGKMEQTWSPNYPISPVISQARIISSPVAFTTKAYSSVTYLHPHAAPLSIATELFDNTFLHKKIREEGGAYGTGATYMSMAGFFYFHSYRDPHIGETLAAFDLAIDRIAMGQFTPRDLEEAKLGIVQQFDTPISPGARALTAYSWYRDGKTHQIRQTFRSRILSVNHNQVQRAVEQQLLPHKREGVIVTFAGKNQIEKENARLHPPLPVMLN